MSARSPPREKSRPATAARSVSARSAGSRRSSRPARSASTVGGTDPSAPGPASWRMRAAARGRAGSPGNPDDLGPCLLVEGLGCDLFDQHARLRVGQGLQGEDSVPRAPSGPLLDQFSPCETKHEERSIRRPRVEVLDEVEERGLGPVDVLEHHDDSRSRASASRKRRTAQNTSPVEAAPSPVP